MNDTFYLATLAKVLSTRWTVVPVAGWSMCAVWRNIYKVKPLGLG